jgi:hypothetical protein
VFSYFVQCVMVSSIDENMADLARQKVVDLMNSLPLAGMAELSHETKELSRKYNPQPLPPNARNLLTCTQWSEAASLFAPS